MSETNDTTQVASVQPVDPEPQNNGIFGVTPQAPPVQQANTVQDLPEWAQAEIEKTRKESADRRAKLRELEAQLKEYAPLAEKAKQEEEARKSEADKLREQVEALKADQLKAQAEADTARKQAKLVTIAAKAGVSPDVIELLDISKLDFENEEATINQLKKLAPARISGGGPSNPAGEQSGAVTNSDLRNMYFGGGRGPRNLIFGGNK